MEDLRIRTYAVGQIGTNCYIVYRERQESTGSEDLIPAVMVDPGDNGAFLLNKCRELKVRPEAVLLTHGHFDHIMAVEEIRRAFPGLPVLAGEGEETLLSDPGANLSSTFGTGFALKADRFLKDGEVFGLAGIPWKVMRTPGHTSGSVCYYIEEEHVLLSGDTLFAESLGRTDFPTGSAGEIVRSINGKLFALPDDTMVYPGHGEATTIGHEKQYNPVAHYGRG